MYNKVLKNNKGYTFVEMIVAITLFSVVMVLVMNIFQSTTESQRNAIASQNIQESLKYFLETLSKDIRSARIGEISSDKTNHICEGGVLNSATNKVFNVDGGYFYFKNKNGFCSIYQLDAGRIKVYKNRLDVDGVVGHYVTPTDIEIVRFDVTPFDVTLNTFHDKQPYVTIVIEARMKTGKDIHKFSKVIQTTVSARMYD